MCMCVYVGGAVKALMCAPLLSSSVPRLLFPSQRAFGWAGPRGVVTPHSFPIIPGVSLRAAPSPFLFFFRLAFPLAPEVPCFHPHHYFLGLLAEGRMVMCQTAREKGGREGEREGVREGGREGGAGDLRASAAIKPECVCACSVCMFKFQCS